MVTPAQAAQAAFASASRSFRARLLGVAALLCLATTCFGIELHVSPTGDDAAAGTAAAPFQTLGRARDALRAAGPAGSTVWIHGGTYSLTEPLELTAQDSGAAGKPVVYRAVAGEQVWLSGGLTVPRDAFTTVGDPALLERIDPAARPHVRQLKLSVEQLAKLSPPWPDTWWAYGRQVTSLSELYHGDRRLALARWPNEGYSSFGEIVEPANQEGQTPVFKYLGDRPERWRAAVAEGLWLYGYWRRGYRAEFIKVRAIDPVASTIALAARNSLGNLETGGARRYCVMGVPEELDAPGEWCLDRARGLVLLWPPEPAAPLTLSVNPTAVVWCRDAAHLELRGLGIEHVAGCGIQIDGGSDCRVVACEIRDVGVHGIQVTGARQAIVGCDIHDTGDRAVALNSGDRYKLVAGESVIDNCWLHHTNRIVRAGSQAVSLGGVGNRLSHNLIHDTGYIAVSFSGNDHVLEHNRLFRTNVESSEGGVFYTGRDWTSRGSVIRGNFIHHVEDSQEGCGSSTRFVHLDDSAPEIEVCGNVCYRLGGGVSICGGAANRVHDNLFVECAWGVDIGPRGADMFEPDGAGGYKMVGQSGWSSLAKLLERYHWNQPPYSTRYPKLVEIFAQRPVAAPWFNVVERNLMVACGAGIRASGMEPGWSTVERNWSEGEPGFAQTDHTRLDFRLAAEAKVVKELGFQPPDMSRVGPYASPDRRTWPVPLDLPPADWRPRWMHLRDEARKSPHGLPVFRVMKVTGKIVVDGVVDPMEWVPGDATGRAPEIHDTAELVWTASGGKAARPSQAMFQTDETHLYLNFRNEIDPAQGVSGGHQWGRDDAVELALAEVAGGQLGPIIVLRGYADGTWESSSEAGAPPQVVRRAREGVKYAAKTSGPAMWCAEWSIPFASLGLDPAKRNPRLVFNLSVRKPAGDEWVTWRSKPGRTWEVRDSGFLWLAQFGDMAPDAANRPSQARIDLDSRQAPVMLAPGEGCEVATWAKPLGCYLSAALDDLPTDGWREWSFSFTPKTDGQVVLKLMGAGVPVPGTNEFLPIWFYADDVRVEGAELVNGDFETTGPQGVPAGWRADVKPGLYIQDPKLAASGQACVKTTHNHRFAQPLKVTAGRTITIRLKVRGLPTGP